MRADQSSTSTAAETGKDVAGRVRDRWGRDRASSRWWVRATVVAMAIACIACAWACGQLDHGDGSTEPTGRTAQPLTTGPIYGNPDASQQIQQPTGTMLSVNRIEGIRYADQFWDGGDIGAAISAAVADLGTSGGTVIVPAGSYTLTTTINVNEAPPVDGGAPGPHSVILQGQGTPGPTSTLYPDGSVAVPSQTAATFIQCTTCPLGPTGQPAMVNGQYSVGLQIRNMSFLANTSQTGGTVIDLSNASHAVVADSAVSGPGGVTSGGWTLLNLYNAENVEVRDNSLAWSNYAILGHESPGVAVSVTVHHNWISNYYGAAIQNGGSSWLVSNNTFEPGSSGLAYVCQQGDGGTCDQGAYNVSFIGNWMGDDSVSNKPWIDWSGHGLVVESNAILCGSIGVDLEPGSDGTVIMGNTFGGCSSSQKQTPVLAQTTTASGGDAGQTGLVIIGNDFTGTYEYPGLVYTNGGPAGADPSNTHLTITGNALPSGVAALTGTQEPIALGYGTVPASAEWLQFGAGGGSPHAASVCWGNGSGDYSLDFGSVSSGAFESQISMYDDGDMALHTGNLSVETAGGGVVLKAPNGTCYRVSVNNSGTLTTASVTCPTN
jgi:hypothetical protein